LRTNRYRQTPLPHHNNCEHMANWCATGWYTENHQIRACFHGLSVIGIAETILPAGRRRTSPSRRLVLTRGIIDAVGVVVVILYNLHIRRFWKDIGAEWDAMQRSQSR